jgi:HAMP domain-containing protein
MKTLRLTLTLAIACFALGAAVYLTLAVPVERPVFINMEGR